MSGLREFTCPKCDSKFMRRFLRNPLCLKCQVDMKVRGGLSVGELKEIRISEKTKKELRKQAKRRQIILQQEEKRLKRIKRIRKMLSEGMSYKQIGIVLGGISRQAVQEFLKKHDRSPQP